jgi:HD-like signal output (HDOD) protein
MLATDRPATATAIPQPPSALSLHVGAELDQQRQGGVLKRIEIPPCPALLVRLQTALAAPEPDLQEVARIASSDVAMAATLLRHANSPLYAVDLPAQTIGQAMNRLGLNQTAALLTAFLLQNTIRADHPRLRRYWEQAALRACALQFMARQLPGVAEDVAHLYGLFCHVGIPVLLQRMPGYSGTMVEAQARRDRCYTATENANHRTDHAVVGALVARVWRVAPAVMAAIRLHHDPAGATGLGSDAEVQTLVAMGQLAEDIMRRRESVPAESDAAHQATLARAWLGVDEEDVADWEHDMQPLLDAV